ncbi:MAG: TlpA family protein disulfide reductase [Rubripirellula sp.]
MSQPKPHSPQTPAKRPNQQISLWWLLFPLFLLSAGLYANWSAPDSTGRQSPAVGKPAPQLDLVRLENTPKLNRLESAAAGKVSLVHFWGTWCGPCKMEYPHLTDMVQKYESNPGFQFVPISCEGTSTETFAGLLHKTDNYFESQGIRSVAFADPRGITRRSAAERLEQSSLYYPTTLVVSPDGMIAGVWEGYTPDAVDQIEHLITEILPPENISGGH